MARPSSRPFAKKPTVAAVDSALQTAQSTIQLPLHQETTQLCQGPVPPPAVLEHYDRLVSGTAARMFQLAEEESLHRRRLEDQANSANVATQAKQLEIADYQTRAVFRSDAMGQAAGLFVSVSCIVGSVFLALNGRELGTLGPQ